MLSTGSSFSGFWKVLFFLMQEISGHIRMIHARPGAQFKLNKFYKDIAVGTGAGLRFDFYIRIGKD